MEVRIVKKSKKELMEYRPHTFQHVGAMVNYLSSDFVILLVDNEFVMIKGRGFHYRSNYFGDEPVDVEGITVKEIVESYPWSELVGVISYVHDYMEGRSPDETTDEVVITIPED